MGRAWWRMAGALKYKKVRKKRERKVAGERYEVRKRERETGSKSYNVYFVLIPEVKL